jgi:hypothetical protein
MKLSRGRLTKIFKKHNQSHKVSFVDKRKRNITCSSYRKKQNNNLHNKTLKRSFSCNNTRVPYEDF